MTIDRYPHGVPAETSFIKVIGEDGAFYDLVNSRDAKAHKTRLINEGYIAKTVSPKMVPSCTLRDFTDSLNAYIEVAFKGGGDFYHK